MRLPKAVKLKSGKMKRMGHKTENMLQNVYQHTISDVADEFDALIDEKMEKLYNG